MSRTHHATPVPIDDEEPPRKVTVGKVIAVVAFLAMAVFWAWAFNYQLTNQGEKDMLDRLDDLAWTPAADDICQLAHDDIAQLTPAHEAKDADERADTIEVATARVEQMLVQLEQIAPTGDSRDARITRLWIADYRVFLADRLAYADAIRDDPQARFVVTEKYGSHITKPIDRFARVNEMEACMSPGDV
ncbi:MAG: hypothetical protein WC184_00960 [Acidimicrobiia bacterium]